MVPPPPARRTVVVPQPASVGIPVRSLDPSGPPASPSKAAAPSSSICGYGSDASKAHKSNISSELRKREREREREREKEEGEETLSQLPESLSSAGEGGTHGGIEHAEGSPTV